MQLDSLFQKDIKSINYNDIVNLVQNQTPESDQLEYKMGFPPKWVLAKIMVGFANAKGGLIIMGISETAGKLTIEGVPGSINYINNLLDTRGFYADQIDYDIHVISIPEKPDHAIVVIKIEKSSNPIQFIDKNQEGIYYFRFSDTVLPIRDKNELDKIIQSPKEEKLANTIDNGETEQIEFKATYKWDIKENRVNKDLPYEISREICGFQNSRGGTLFIGVMDNGDIYGLERDIKILRDLDKLQQDISATVRRDLGGRGMDFEMSIESIKGKKICIIEVERSEYPVFFQNRDFFIRRGTSCHGLNAKETYDYILGSNSRLKFEFQGEEIDIFYPFEIVLSLTIPELELAYFDPNRSAGLRFLQWDFLSDITPEISMEIRSDSDKIKSFFQEIIPYALLYSLSKNFYRTWQFTQYPHERRYGKPNIPMDKISLENIPNLPDDSLLSKLSINMKEFMKKRFFNDICVPQGTEIQLGFKVGAFPIIIKNKNFEIKIYHDIFNYGTYLESRHSLLYDIIERDMELKDKKLFHINLSCIYEANFTFPEEYDEYYNYYVEYGKNIKTILMEEWDFNYFLANQPDSILFSMDKKLDKLLITLKKKKKIKIFL